MRIIIDFFCFSTITSYLILETYYKAFVCGLCAPPWMQTLLSIEPKPAQMLYAHCAT